MLLWNSVRWNWHVYNCCYDEIDVYITVVATFILVVSVVKQYCFSTEAIFGQFYTANNNGY